MPNPKKKITFVDSPEEYIKNSINKTQKELDDEKKFEDEALQDYIDEKEQLQTSVTNSAEENIKREYYVSTESQQLKAMEDEEKYNKIGYLDKNTQKMVDAITPGKSAFFNFHFFLGKNEEYDYDPTDIGKYMLENYHRVFLTELGIAQNQNSKDFSVGNFKKAMLKMIALGQQKGVLSDQTGTRTAPDSKTQDWLDKKAKQYFEKNIKGKFKTGDMIQNNPYMNLRSEKTNLDFVDEESLLSRKQAISYGKTLFSAVLSRLTSNGNSFYSVYGLLNKKSLDNGITEFDADKINEIANCISDEEIYQTYLDSWTPERFNACVNSAINNLPGITAHNTFNSPTVVNPKDITSGLEMFARLNVIHGYRSTGWKFLNPVRNIREGNAIDRLKDYLMRSGVKESILDQIAKDQEAASRTHDGAIIRDTDLFKQAVDSIAEKKRLESAYSFIPNPDAPKDNMMKMDNIKAAFDAYAQLRMTYYSHNYFYRLVHSDTFLGMKDTMDHIEARMEKIGVEKWVLENYAEQAKTNIKEGKEMDAGQRDFFNRIKDTAEQTINQNRYDNTIRLEPLSKQLTGEDGLGVEEQEIQQPEPELINVPEADNSEKEQNINIIVSYEEAIKGVRIQKKDGTFIENNEEVKNNQEEVQNNQEEIKNEDIINEGPQA